MEQHSLSTELKVINQRFVLGQQVANTALAEIYQATDRQNNTHTTSDGVLLMLIASVFTQQEGFANAWRHTLSRPAPPTSAYPEIISYGEEGGRYWLALVNPGGQPLSRQISALDERGLALDKALAQLDHISHALSSVQAGPFGHLEPGTIQQTDNGYIILNAPLVRVLQQLPDTARNTSNKLALHSGFISPSVAVGDAPVTEDDTFSAAAILYTLLAGEPPFGSQSSLTSVTHNYKPAHLKKLNKRSWEELSSALAFQRKPRAENIDKLIAALRKARKRKLAFPLAVLAALGLVGFGIYHFASKVGDLIQPSNTSQQADLVEPATPKPVQTIPPRTAKNETTSANNTTIEQNDSATPSEVSKTENSVAEAASSAEQLADTISDSTAATSTEQDNTGDVTDSTEQIAADTEVPEVEPDNTDTTVVADTNQTREADAPEPDIAAVELVDEPEVASPVAENARIQEPPAEQETAIDTTPETTVTDTGNNDTETPDPLKELLKQATLAVDNKQLQDRGGQSGALALIRRINELDEDNNEAEALLNRILDDTLSDAEQLIDGNKQERALRRLRESDRIIREFNASDQLQRLVRLESQLAIVQQEQAQVAELLAKAGAAIQDGRLTSDDADGDYALLHLNNIMFKQPDNPDGLRLLQEIAQRRQQAAQQALDDGELEQAGTYLGESERLIRKYSLTQLAGAQQRLNVAYDNSILQDSAPVAEISPSNQVEVPDPDTGQSTQLPIERPVVNQIGIQELDPQVLDSLPPAVFPTDGDFNNNGQAGTDIVNNIVPIPVPTIDPQTVPIWETGTLNPVQGQTNVQPLIVPPQPAPQPVVRTVQPQVIPPQPIQTEGVYTYQPGDQPIQPIQSINSQIVDQFGANPQSTIIEDPTIPVYPLPDENIGFLPQAQPQAVTNIPEMVPLEIIPELEEIPLSDIEGILPVN